MMACLLNACIVSNAGSAEALFEAGTVGSFDADADDGDEADEIK